MKIFEIKFIKQNVTGNIINEENLKLQIKASQDKQEWIDTLLSEYLDDNTNNKNERKVD